MIEGEEDYFSGTPVVMNGKLVSLCKILSLTHRTWCEGVKI